MKSERQAGIVMLPGVDGFQALQTLFNLNLQLRASLQETAKYPQIHGRQTWLEIMGGRLRTIQVCDTPVGLV
jgi:hypothetical protein